jgi:hypothetical protein
MRLILLEIPNNKKQIPNGGNYSVLAKTNNKKQKTNSKRLEYLSGAFLAQRDLCLLFCSL